MCSWSHVAQGLWLGALLSDIAHVAAVPLMRTKQEKQTVSIVTRSHVAAPLMRTKQRASDAVDDAAVWSSSGSVNGSVRLLRVVHSDGDVDKVYADLDSGNLCDYDFTMGKDDSSNCSDAGKHALILEENM